MKKNPHSQKNSDKNIVVVYHKSSKKSFCDDGFGAAFAAWCHFKDRAFYWPAIHGKQIAIDRFADKEVYFLDFSYSLDIMKEIEKTAKSLTVLDHHKTVIDQVKHHPSFSHCRLDNSGAVLAWYYFHDPKRKQPLPLLIQHIQDSDLWRHKLPDTAAFIQRLRMEKYDFIHWEKLRFKLDNKHQKSYKKYIKEGQLLQKQIIHQCKAMLNQAFPVVLNDILGLAINANRIYASELGHLLAKKSRTFAAVFTVLPEGIIDVSLRSNTDACNVGAIAQSFGGGGHVQASGFRFSDHSLIEKMIL